YNTISFENCSFDVDVHLEGEYKNLSFVYCNFTGLFDLYVVRSLSFKAQNCKFLQPALSNLSVQSFQLRFCYFGAGANLYGAQFKGPVNMTYLTSKEPIRVFWLQFQDHWLQDLEKSAVGKNTELGSEDLATKVREIVTELEFWKDNFNLLGHR